MTNRKEFSMKRANVIWKGAATHFSDDSLWARSGCEITLLHTGPRERLDSIP